MDELAGTGDVGFDKGLASATTFAGQRTVTTVAGGTESFADGAGPAARFNDTEGLAADALGRVLIADASTRRLRLAHK